MGFCTVMTIVQSRLDSFFCAPSILCIAKFVAKFGFPVRQCIGYQVIYGLMRSFCNVLLHSELNEDDLLLNSMDVYNIFLMGKKQYCTFWNECQSIQSVALNFRRTWQSKVESVQQFEAKILTKIEIWTLSSKRKDRF